MPFSYPSPVFLLGFFDRKGRPIDREMVVKLVERFFGLLGAYMAYGDPQGLGPVGLPRASRVQSLPRPKSFYSSAIYVPFSKI